VPDAGDDSVAIDVRRISSLLRAAYLSARNDTLVKVAILGVGAASAATRSIFVDVVGGARVLCK